VTNEEQRDLAVELLECAADFVITGRGAFVAASLEVEASAEVENIAHEAWILAEWDLRECYQCCDADAARLDGAAWFKYEAMLEAARRLAEGGDDAE
jgi:hypothetical protein